MAQTLTTTSVYGFFANRVTTSNGQCISLGGTIQVAGAITVRKNIREQRVKPENLLAAASMTPLSSQLFRREYAGKGARITVTPSWRGCPSRPVMTQYLETMLPTHVMPSGDADPPDWPQAIRLQIAKRRVSFAENIGEYKETVEQLEKLADILKRSGREATKIVRDPKARKSLIRKLKREIPFSHRPKTRRDWWGVIGTHLSITYGVLPALGQLEDVLEQLERLRSRTIRVRATVKTEKSVTQGALAGYRGSALWKQQRSDRAVIYARFSDSHGNFTAGNIASSIWAGITLSFMVDWAINVGGYLESLTALEGVEQTWGTVTTKITSTLRSDIRLNDQSLIDPRTFVERSHSRIVVSAIPMPFRVHVQIPSWNFDKFVSALEIYATMRFRKR